MSLLPILAILSLGIPSALAAEECPNFFAKLYDRAQNFSNQLGDYGAADKRLLAAQFVAQSLAGKIPSAPLLQSDGYFRTGARFVARNAEGFARFLIPFPLPKLRRQEYARVFLDQWKNPRRVLPEADRALLEKANLLASYEGRGKFLRAQPWIRPTRTMATTLNRGLFLTAAAAALDQALEMKRNAVYIDDYLDQPNEDEKGNPTVQLLVETTPFPHAALRIGTKVYSYGTQSFSVSDINEYLASDNSSVKGSAGAVVKGINHGLRRSVRATELHLPRDAVNRMQKELERTAGKEYTNQTFVNDCMVMIARELNRQAHIKIPIMVDTLPSASSAYLSVRKTLGDDRVGRTQMILFGQHDNAPALAARNTLIALEEAKMALSALPTTLPARAYLEATHPEQDLQHFPPEQLKRIAEWQAKARGQLDAELSAIYGNEPPPAATGQEKSIRQVALDSRLSHLRQELTDQLDAPTTAFQEVVEAEAKLSALPAARTRWADKLGIL